MLVPDRLYGSLVATSPPLHYERGKLGGVRYTFAYIMFHTIRVESCFFHLQLVFSTILTGMNVIYISK